MSSEADAVYFQPLRTIVSDSNPILAQEALQNQNRDHDPAHVVDHKSLSAIENRIRGAKLKQQNLTQSLFFCCKQKTEKIHIKTSLAKKKLHTLLTVQHTCIYKENV